LTLGAVAALSVLALVVEPVAPAAAARPHRSRTAAPRTSTTGVSNTTTTTIPDLASRCPWLESAIDRGESPGQLAQAVLERMTVTEKVAEIALVSSGDYENVNAGIPRLCIPALTLQDGPQGMAFGAQHVTQLPAPLGVAATFDTGIARAYGEVQGSEAVGQGVDVVQGPTLNIDRVPQSGRTYEGFGEDPVLVSAMGVADIRGIQETGAMAMAKHFAVYNQETDRSVLNDAVSQRALEELYLPPFEAAVTQADVSAVMCAYPRLNGTFECQDGALLDLLQQWGFTGFVRSDLGSVHDPLAAITAGTDLIKPARVDRLAPLVGQPGLSVSAVDAAVTRLLTAMFAHGLVGRSDAGSPDSVVDSPAHAALSLTAAERSAVLLKDQRRILPLAPSRPRSVAVIGADASSAPVTTGYGSSQVLAPFTSTPLAAIRRRAGSGTTVTYANGGSTTRPLPPVPAAYLTPASGVGHGLTLTLAQTGAGPGARPVQSVEPTVDVSMRTNSTSSQLLPGLIHPPSVERRRPPIPPGRLLPLGGPPRTTRSPVVLPAGWSDASASWTGTLTPPKTGLYTMSLQGDGQAQLTLDGKPVVSDTLNHALGRWSQTVSLVAGHPYQVRLDWEPVDATNFAGQSLVVPSSLTLGWRYVSDDIAAAGAAARAANVAVVFAGDYSSEAFDRPSLSLPGDENQLITAVAAANPHTVVVLNTGGPVLMPWLAKVAGVIEDWYPGEQAGSAIAALLFGDVDPGGRLPVTFPTSDASAAINTTAQWPGVDFTATYTEGLDVGYRYNHATGVQPLFPFGYGLSYTRFTLGKLGVRRTAAGYALTVRVSNKGGVAGTDVPQAYLTYPAAAGEPPAQLVAFAPVTLGAGETRTVTLSVPASAFESYLNGSWSTTPGTYILSVGQSSADLALRTQVAAP
jgi:beta-glucosidase